MSFADDKKRKKERASFSSPDRFRQDTIEEQEKQSAKIEAKNKLSKLQRDTLQREIEDAKEKSAPVQNANKEIVQSQEQANDAKEFSDKNQAREEERKAAINQSGPESKSEEMG